MPSVPSGRNGPNAHCAIFKDTPPPLTHRAVLAIAAPIIIANITTPLIGIVDTAVLGQLGPAHLIGAVAIGAVIFNMVYWAFGFLRMGTTGLTAQADGSGDAREVAAGLSRALLIAVAAGTVLIVLQGPIRAVAFHLMEGSRISETEAQTYFTIRIWSAPAALANYVFLGWFIGLGRAGTALALQVVLNLTNALLDAGLVLGFHLGVAGVAYGTLIAEVLAAVVGLAIAAREIARRGGWPSWARVRDRAGFSRVISVNGDIMIRTLCLLAAFTFFTAQSAAQGDAILAANAVLMQFVSFSAFFLDGFAFSAETLVGRTIGGRHPARFREAIRLSSLWAGGISLALTVVLLVAGGAFIDLLTVNATVRADARVYLAWAAVLPAVSVACYQLDGVFIGATRTADMRNMMLVSLGIFLAAWAVLMPAFGNHGLWAALLVLNVARAGTLSLRFPALERDAFATTS